MEEIIVSCLGKGEYYKYIEHNSIIKNIQQLNYYGVYNISEIENSINYLSKILMLVKSAVEIYDKKKEYRYSVIREIENINQIKSRLWSYVKAR